MQWIQMIEVCFPKWYSIS